MFWIFMILLCFFAGGIGGSIVANSQNQKDQEGYDLWETKEVEISLKDRIKQLFRKINSILGVGKSSFKETVKEMRQVKERK